MSNCHQILNVNMHSHVQRGNEQENISEWMNNNPAGDTSGLKTFWGILLFPLVVPRAILFGTTAVISYPIETYIGILAVDGIYGGTPPANGYSAGSKLVERMGLTP